MNFQSSADFIDNLNKFFNGFIALPLLMVGFGYLEIYSGNFSGFMILDSWYYSLPLIAMVVGVMIYFSRTFMAQIRKIDASLIIVDKVDLYFKTAKKFYLQVFFLSMFTTGLLFLFGEKSFAGAYAFILFMLSVNRPNLASIASQLQLTGDDRRDFIEKTPF